MGRVAVIAGAALAVLAGICAAGLWLGNRTTKVFFAEDAVQVIAYGVGAMYRQNPATTEEDIALKIKFLNDASVINLRLADNDEAVDPFGIPFDVKHETQGSVSVTTVTSAGPDRRLGTADDIVFVHKEDHEAERGAPADPPSSNAAHDH